MQVRDLAKELEVDPEAVLELLGKKSPNDNVTDADVSKVQKTLGVEPKASGTPKKAKAGRAADVLRFWSGVRSFSLPVIANGEQKLVYFKDYSLQVVKDGPTHKALVALRDPEVKLVVDEPFEDIGQISRFRKLLESRLYTGMNQEVSYDAGMAFVMALFDNDDYEKAAKAFSKYGPDGLIEVAVRSKSYIEQPYKG